jgi:hypothetical protein
MTSCGRTGLSREVDRRHSILCSALWTVGTRDEPATSWGLEEEWSVCHEKTSENWEEVCSHLVRFYTRRSDDDSGCVCGSVAMAKRGTSDRLQSTAASGVRPGIDPVSIHLMVEHL